MSGDIITDAGARPTVALAEGLLAWWALAGVDQAVDEQPVDWLRPQSSATPATPSPAAKSRRGYPDTLSSFHEYLSSATDLPEGIWPGRRVLPRGPQGARLMIIVDAPDTVAAQEGVWLGEGAARLLSRMTHAIGLDLGECYLASLSLVAPPAAVIPDITLGRLTERMRHHIGLVAPSALLLLGDVANRALISTEGAEVPESLPFVNHSAGMVAAASVAHLRVMMGQPSAKAEAWRALQGLTGGWGR